MPATVDDFIQRFGNPESMDDQSASHYLDRFASNAPQDQEFDTHALSSGASEYLGRLPDPQFQQAAQSAYANATPAQQQGLLGSLTRALQSRGIDLGRVFGQGGQVPAQVSPNQYAQAASYARQQHPDVMKDVVSEQPWLIKAMGHPILMGALGMVAGHMMKNRLQSSPAPQAAQPSGVGGLLGKLF